MSDDFFEGDWELAEATSNSHDVELDVTVSTSGFAVGSPADEGRSGPRTSSPTQPIAPPTSTGTLGFPADNEQFMQSLEIRGKNGHDEPVETVYALVLTDGEIPRLVALDEPKMYEAATKRSVSYYVDPMAEEVARQCGGSTPDAVIKFHTHPSGSTKPSEKDKSGTETTRRIFQENVGGSFTFLQGIHAYKSGKVNPSKMRDPVVADGSVSWHGERFRHTLAVFDAHFNRGPEVNTI